MAAGAEATFFDNAAAWRAWLEQNHDKLPSLLVGFLKTRTREPSLTYKDALDEALCFGWIDGVRKSLDERRYTIRFAPRKARSYWSAVNTRRAHELVAAGRMEPPGQSAFDKRDEQRTEQYFYERQEAAVLDPTYAQQFQADRAAWRWFQAQAPFYRRECTAWVMTAKREDTRRRRLEQLIDCSSRGVKAPPFPK
jgi:uncharacterized protein YdeI (YjbR/CyaY-like superfamily)